MALTSNEQQNTVADAFDAEYRTFSGPPFRSLMAQGLDSISAWTAPDVGFPTNWTDKSGNVIAWTDISARTSYRATLTKELRGKAITWNLQLSGEDYDEALLGVGKTIVQFVRYRRNDGSAWQPWIRHLIGGIDERTNNDDYKHGQNWTRVVRGADLLLEQKNSPRLVFGPVDITKGSSIAVPGVGSGGDTDPVDPEELDDISTEVGLGEFIGMASDASPKAANVADGNKNTVWISRTSPGQEKEPAYADCGRLIVAEMFIKPNPVIDSNLWWFELYNAGGGSQYVFFVDQDGHWLTHTYNGTFEIRPHSFAIVCSNLEQFNRYTGGAGDDCYIIDASQFSGAFKPTCNNSSHIGYFLAARSGYTGREDDYASIPAACSIAWTDAPVKQVKIPFWHTWLYPGAYQRDEYIRWTWDYADCIDIATLPQGWSVKHIHSGSAGTYGPQYYQPCQFPAPGQLMPATDGIYLKVQLPENVASTTVTFTRPAGTPGADGRYADGETIVPLDNYVGFIADGSEQWAVISGAQNADNGKFRIASRGTNGLVVDRWLTGNSVEFALGSRVYPLENGPASDPMTGYPVVASSLVRRKKPVPEHYELYVSKWPDTTGDRCMGWGSLYYPYNDPANPWYISVCNESNLVSKVSIVPSPSSKYTWVRTLLYVIYSMTTPRATTRYTGVGIGTGWPMLMVDDGSEFPSSGTCYIKGNGKQPSKFSYGRREGNWLKGIIWLDVKETAYYPSDSPTVECVTKQRAKVNEVAVDLYQSAEKLSNMPLFDGGQVIDMLNWLWTYHLGFAKADLAGKGLSTYAHPVGRYSLAITAMSSVFSDVARMSGVMVDYHPSGVVYVESEPRWKSTGMSITAVNYTFTGSSLRGTVTMRDKSKDLDCLVVDFTDVTNPSLPETVRRMSPRSQVGWDSPMVGERSETVNGYNVNSHMNLQALADMLYQERIQNQTFSFTVKGIGEWCHPGLVIELTYDLGEGVFTYRGIITKVTQSRGIGPVSLRTDVEMMRW